MKVTYVGHACLQVESHGVRILMDPWLTDPTYHGTWWHYPPLTLGLRDLPRPDYLYISHEHPDHFDPATLRHVDKDVCVLIPNYRRKRFRDRIAALGFRHLRELEFGEEFPCNSGSVRLRLIAPDRPWDDSAILVQDSETTLLNVNDCHLDDATLERLGREQQIDLAFLTFTGASQYPGCFEFPLDSKIERWAAAKQAHLDEFVSWAQLLRARRAVPAAGNYALLAPDQVFMNTSHYVSTPQEAVEALRARAPEIDGLQLNPGDVWRADGGVERLRAAPDWSKRLEHIEALSQVHRGQIAEYFASEGDAPADLYDQFYAYFTGLLHADPSRAKRIGIVTWWVVDGPRGGDWVIDFTRERDWISRGVPAHWNLRLRFPARLLHQGITGEAIWDNLILSFRVRLARQPDRYMKEFWTWLSKL